jgi:NADH oxidase (H2O2-forming)
MRIIIVGLNSAGIGAALSARKINYDAEIVVYEMEKYTAYSRCGLPFVIGKEIESFDKLIDFPDEFYEKMDIEINLETEVLEIDTKNKEIKVKGKKGISTDKYDKLIRRMFIL